MIPPCPTSPRRQRIPHPHRRGIYLEVIFPVLADPVRRRLLLSLARGEPRPASVLKAGVARRLDATLKHLVALRAAGLLLTRPDPADGRRMLYALSPTVPVTKTERGAVIDFGCCVVRLS